VPVNQFRLQRRAGLGLRAIKFRRSGDELVGLKVLGAGVELLLISERGVIVRMQSDAIPQQSRAATGVRLQKLDSGDHLSELVLIPPALESEEAGEVVIDVLSEEVDGETVVIPEGEAEGEGEEDTEADERGAL